MDERAEWLVQLAAEHGPTSIRHLFYLAVVNAVPGITKDERGYAKVQRQVLELRRENRISYRSIVDGTRWVRAGTWWDSATDALETTAQAYRRNLWSWSEYLVEVWCESDSIAGVIGGVVDTWTLPLMVTRGDVSETFANEIGEQWRRTPDREPVVLYVGDHDGAGLDIETKVQDKLTRFYGSDDFEWCRVGVTLDQALEHDLPGQPAQPKDFRRGYAWDEKWEAEAMPPDMIRGLIDDAIREYANPRDLAIIEAAEESERDLLFSMANKQTVSPMRLEDDW